MRKWKLVVSNVWNVLGKFEAICITTNGFVTRDGRAVMGRGVAKQAKDKFKKIDYILGKLIRKNGNVVQKIVPIATKPTRTVLVAFPVKPAYGKCNRKKDNIVSHVAYKYNPGDKVPGFHMKADLNLIEKSLKQLVKLADNEGWKKIALVMPGVGNGGLDRNEVEKLLDKHLDNRFYVFVLTK